MSGLPSGYTQLEYIQSSGKQYINTAFKPKSTSRVVMDVHLLSPENYPYIFGVWTSSMQNCCSVYFDSSAGWTVDHGTTRTAIGTAQWDARLTVDLNGDSVSIGTTSALLPASSFSQTLSMFLLAHNSAGSPALNSAAKLYSCAIYDNGALVRNFVPCKNASGAVGLYDTVGRQFYANAGTGTFTAGPEIIPDPPAAPTGLHTVLAVVLQWAASANADRYDVYRDGAKLGSTETTQYVDATPEANQTYVYTVKAVNGGGESAGTSITVYTKSGYFEYKPLIESANFP